MSHTLSHKNNPFRFWEQWVLFHFCLKSNLRGIKPVLFHVVSLKMICSVQNKRGGSSQAFGRTGQIKGKKKDVLYDDNSGRTVRQH